MLIAAGGLGTRVRRWSRFLPKEFYPVCGQPAIVHLLTEIAALGSARVAVVYHPYYEPFIDWARHTLTPEGLAHYEKAARLPAALPPRQESIDLLFIRQHGPYSDTTSVLNAAAHLHGDELYVAFADNLYLEDNPTLALRTAPAGSVSVLARPYNPRYASSRGVIVCTGASDRRLMIDLIEKPTPDRARALQDRYGTENLRLLEGRTRLTQAFIRHLSTTTQPTGAEPKLSLTLGEYARTNPVHVITTTSSMIDLGSPHHGDTESTGSLSTE